MVYNFLDKNSVHVHASKSAAHTGTWIKVGLSPSEKKNEIPLQVMENAFYFILKALFILKVLKLLSWLYGHWEKTAWLER